MASWRWNNCERRSTRLSREKRGSTATDHPACNPSRPSGVVEPEGEAGLLLLQSLGSPPLSVHANPNGVVVDGLSAAIGGLGLSGDIPIGAGQTRGGIGDPDSEGYL